MIELELVLLVGLYKGTTALVGTGGEFERVWNRSSSKSGSLLSPNFVVVVVATLSSRPLPSFGLPCNLDCDTPCENKPLEDDVDEEELAVATNLYFGFSKWPIELTDYNKIF